MRSFLLTLLVAGASASDTATHGKTDIADGDRKIKEGFFSLRSNVPGDSGVAVDVGAFFHINQGYGSLARTDFAALPQAGDKIRVILNHDNQDKYSLGSSNKLWSAPPAATLFVANYDDGCDVQPLATFNSDNTQKKTYFELTTTGWCSGYEVRGTQSSTEYDNMHAWTIYNIINPTLDARYVPEAVNFEMVIDPTAASPITISGDTMTTSLKAEWTYFGGAHARFVTPSETDNHWNIKAVAGTSHKFRIYHDNFHPTKMPLFKVIPSGDNCYTVNAVISTGLHGTFTYISETVVEGSLTIPQAGLLSSGSVNTHQLCVGSNSATGVYQKVQNIGDCNVQDDQCSNYVNVKSASDIPSTVGGTPTLSVKLQMDATSGAMAAVAVGVRSNVYVHADNLRMSDNLGLTKGSMPWFKIVSQTATDCTAAAVAGTHVQLSPVGGNRLVASVLPTSGCCDWHKACVAQTQTGTYHQMTYDSTTTANAKLYIIPSVTKSGYTTGVHLTQFVTLEGTGFSTTVTDSTVTLFNSARASESYFSVTPTWVSPDGSRMVVEIDGATGEPVGTEKFLCGKDSCPGISVEMHTKSIQHTDSTVPTNIYAGKVQGASSSVNHVQVLVAATGNDDWLKPFGNSNVKIKTITRKKFAAGTASTYNGLNTYGELLTADETATNEDLITAEFYTQFSKDSTKREQAMIWFQLASPAQRLVPGSTVSFHLHATGPLNDKHGFLPTQQIYLQKAVENTRMECSGTVAAGTKSANAYLPFINGAGTSTAASASYAFTEGILLDGATFVDTEIQVCLDYDGTLSTKTAFNFEDYRRHRRHFDKYGTGKGLPDWKTVIQPTLAHLIPGALATTTTDTTDKQKLWVAKSGKPSVAATSSMAVIAGQKMVWTIVGGTGSGNERIFLGSTASGGCNNANNKLKDADGATYSWLVNQAIGDIGIDSTVSVTIPYDLKTDDTTIALCYNADGINDDAYRIVGSDNAALVISATHPTWALGSQNGAVAGNLADITLTGGDASGNEFLFVVSGTGSCAQSANLLPGGGVWRVTAHSNTATMPGTHMPALAAGDYKLCYNADGQGDDAYAISTASTSSTTHKASSNVLQIVRPTWAVHAYGYKALVAGNRVKLAAKATATTAITSLSGHVHLGSTDCKSANMIPGSSAAWSKYWAGSKTLNIPATLTPGATYKVCHNGYGRTWAHNDHAYAIQTHSVSIDSVNYPKQSGMTAGLDMVIQAPYWKWDSSTYAANGNRIRGSNLINLYIYNGLRVSSSGSEFAGSARETVWLEKSGAAQQCVSQNRMEKPVRLSGPSSGGYDTASSLHIGIATGSYVVCYDVQGRGIGAVGYPIYDNGASIVVDNSWNPTWGLATGSKIPSGTGVGNTVSSTKAMKTTDTGTNFAAVSTSDYAGTTYSTLGAATTAATHYQPSKESNSRVQFQLYLGTVALTLPTGTVSDTTVYGGDKNGKDIYGVGHHQVVWQENDANECVGDDDSWIVNYLSSGNANDWKDTCHAGVASGSTGTSWGCVSEKTLAKFKAGEPFRGDTNLNSLVKNSSGKTPDVNLDGTVKTSSGSADETFKYAYSGFVLGTSAGVFKLCYSPTGDTSSGMAYEIFEKDTGAKLVTKWPTFTALYGTSSPKALQAFQLTLVGGTGQASNARTLGSSAETKYGQAQNTYQHVHLSSSKTGAPGTTTDCDTVGEVYYTTKNKVCTPDCSPAVSIQYPMGYQSTGDTSTAGVQCTSQATCEMALHFSSGTTSSQNAATKLYTAEGGTFTVCYTQSGYIAAGVSLGTVSVAPADATTSNSLTKYPSRFAWLTKQHYTYAKGSRPMLDDLNVDNNKQSWKQAMYHLVTPSGDVGVGDAVRLFTSFTNTVNDYCPKANYKNNSPILEYTGSGGGWVWSAAFSNDYVGTFRMCHCDASMNDGNGNDENTVDPNCALDDDYDYHWSSSPGWAHIVDAKSVKYVPGKDQGLFYNHYTVMAKATGTQQITIPFNSGLTTSDKFYFAQGGQGMQSRCGINEQANNLVGTGYINTDPASADSNSWVIPRFGFGKAAAADGAAVTMEQGRALICMCASSFNTCDTSIGNYGAQVGTLHVLSNDRFRHVTVGNTGASRFSLPMTAQFASLSKATIINDVRTYRTSTSMYNPEFGYGTCGTFASEASPGFLDGSSSSISSRTWNTFGDNNSKSIYTNFIANSGDGSASGKGRVCICDISFEEECKTIDAATDPTGVAPNGVRYGATWGWVHKVNTDKLDLHITVLVSSTEQAYKINFLSAGATSQTPQGGAGMLNGANDRVMLVSESQTCGVALDWKQDGTILNESGTVSTAPGSKYTTWSGKVTSTTKASKAKLCYCNAKSESIKYSNFGSDSCLHSTESEVIKFGIELGHIHVVDATRFTHVSLAKGTGQTSPNYEKFTVSIKNADANDRFYLVASDAMCGDAEAGSSIGSLSTNGSSTNTYSNDASSITLSKVQLSSIVGVSVGSALKTKLCLCDADVEFGTNLNAANDIDCDGKVETSVTLSGVSTVRRTLFGAHAGFVHIVDVDRVPSHHTIAFGTLKASIQKIELTFKNAPNAGSRMALLTQSDSCSVGALKTAPYTTGPAMVSGKVASFGIDGAENSAGNNLNEATAAAKLKICYCNADTDMCDGSVESFNNEIGFLHTVDMNRLGFHYTVGRNSAGHNMKVKFKGNENVEGTDRFSVTETGSSCGNPDNKLSTTNPIFDDIGGPVLAAETKFSLLAVTAEKAPSTAAKFNVLSVHVPTPKAAGKLNLCFCDHSAETACGGVANFGAKLGSLHVVDIDNIVTHFTIPVNGGAVAELELTFKSQQNVDDKFWLVDQSDSAVATCGTVEAPHYPKSPGLLTSTVGGAVTPSNTVAPTTDGKMKFNVKADHHGVAQLCFCDLSTESACATPTVDTASYGASLGFVHAVNMKSLNLHVTIGKAAQQNFALRFDDVTNGGQPNEKPQGKIRLVGLGADCTSAAGVSSTSTDMGATGDVQQDKLQQTSAANPADHFPVVKFLPSQGVSYKLADNSRLTGTANFKKLSICFCDQAVQADVNGAMLAGSDCGSPDATGGDANTKVNYAAQIGFLHVVGIERVGSHITLAAPTSKSTQITVTFVSDYKPSLINRFMFVKPDRPCNYVVGTEVLRNIQDTTIFADTMSTGVENSAKDAPQNVLLLDVTRTPNRGKSRLCMCDFQGEGLSVRCIEDTNDVEKTKKHFGTEVAWVHVLDIDSVGQSFTIAKEKSQKVTVTFNSAGEHEGDDQFMLIDAYTGHCGLSKESTAVWASVNGVDTSSLSGNTYTVHPVTPDADSAVPKAEGKAKMCFCDQSAALGADDIEKSCASRDEYWRFGGDLGFLHVVDVADVGLQYTIAKAAKQSFEVTFKNFVTSNLDDRVMLVRWSTTASDLGHCGSSVESVYTTNTAAGLVDTFQSSALESSVTFTAGEIDDGQTQSKNFKVGNIKAYLPGKAKICFCDYDKEGTTLDDATTRTACAVTKKQMFGADLGMLHVVDVVSVPMHTTVLASGTLQWVSVEFNADWNSRTGLADRFRIVSVKDKCVVKSSENVELIKATIYTTALSTRTDIANHRGVQVTTEAALKKIKLCYCDNLVEGQCGTDLAASYGDFGAELGFVHSVDLASSEFQSHVTMAAVSKSRKFTVTFANSGFSGGYYINQAYMVVPASKQCATAEDTSIFGGSSVNKNVVSTTPANSAPSQYPVSSFEFKDELVFTAGKVKVCTCNPTTETVNTDGTCGTKVKRFGAELKFVHVVDLKSVAMHFTVKESTVDTQTVTIDFTSTPDVNDRVVVVAVDGNCGSSAPVTSGVSTASSASLQTAIPVRFPNAEGMSLQWSGVRGGNTRLKNKVCFCDTSAEKNECKEDKNHFGAEIGYVHVVSLNESPPIHVTMGKSNAKDQKLKVQFTGTDKTAYAADRFMTVEAGVPCASQQAYITLFGNSNIQDSTTDSTQVSTSGAGIVEVAVVETFSTTETGKAKICLCDADVEGSCTNADKFGAELGFAHVVDLAKVGSHYTVAGQPDQALKVTFTTASAQATDRFRGLSDQTSACGGVHGDTAKAGDPFSAGGEYKAGDTFETQPYTLVSPLFTPTTKSSKSKLCFCDSDIEGGCTLDASYGAELGTLHVIDTSVAPLHFSKVASSSDTTLLIDFVTDVGGFDKFRFVEQSLDCITGTQSFNGEVVGGITLAIPSQTQTSGKNQQQLQFSKTGSAKDYKICFCDYSVEGSTCSNNSNFGAILGYFHVVDVAELKHFTIHNGVENQQISVEFLTTTPAFGSTANQFNTVLAANQCATHQESTLVTGFVADSFKVENRKLTATAKTPASGSVGTTNLCYCNAATCQSEKDFGAQVAFVHVANRIGVIQNSADSTKVGSTTSTLDFEFSVPTMNVESFSGTIQLKFPSGWSQASARRRLLSMDAVTMQVFNTANPNVALEAPEVTDSSCATCIQVKLAQGVAAGTNLKLKVKNFKIPSAGAKSDDAELTLYRASTSDATRYQIVETYEKNVLFPTPTDGADITSAAIYLSETTKSASGVTATVNFATPQTTTSATHVKIAFPVGFAGVQDSVVVTNINTGTALAKETVTVTAATSTAGVIVEFTTSALAVEPVTYTFSALTVPSVVTVPAQSVVISLSDDAKKEVAVKNNNVYPRAVQNAVTKATMTLDNTVGNTAGVGAKVVVGMPKLLHVPDGAVVRLILDKAWTFSNPVVTSDVGIFTTTVSTTADNTIVEMTVTKGADVSEKDVTFSITNVNVPAPSETQPQKLAAQIAFKEASPAGEVILTQIKADANANSVPKVTSAITKVYVGTSSTVTGDKDQTVRVMFVSPAALTAGDHIELMFPNAAWSSSTHVVEFPAVTGGWDGKGAGVAYTTLHTITLPAGASFAAGSEVSITIKGVTIPAFGTAVANGMVQCRLQDKTIVTYNKQVTFPAVTRPMEGTKFSLSNTVANNANSVASVVLTTSGGIPDLTAGALIEFEFPVGFLFDNTNVYFQEGPLGTKAKWTPKQTVAPVGTGQIVTLEVPATEVPTVLRPTSTYVFTFEFLTNSGPTPAATTAKIKIKQTQKDGEKILYTDSTVTHQLAGVEFPAIWGPLKKSSAGKLNIVLSNTMAGASGVRAWVRAGLPDGFAIARGDKIRVVLPDGFAFNGVKIEGTIGNSESINYVSLSRGVEFTSDLPEIKNDLEFTLEGVTISSTTGANAAALFANIYITDPSGEVTLTSSAKDAVTLPTISGPCSNDGVSLTNTVAGSTGESATVAFTSGADVPTDARLVLTLPQAWPALTSEPSTITVTHNDGGHEIKLQAMPTPVTASGQAAVEYKLDGASSVLIKGRTYRFTIANAFSIPTTYSLGSLIGVPTETARLDIKTKEGTFDITLTHNSARVTAAGTTESFLAWPRVAARVTPVTRALDKTLESSVATGVFSFKIPAGVAMKVNDAVDLQYPAAWAIQHDIAPTLEAAGATVATTAVPQTNIPHERTVRFTVSAAIAEGSTLTFTYPRCITVPRFDQNPGTNARVSVVTPATQTIPEIVLASGNFLWVDVASKITRASMEFSASAIGAKDIGIKFSFDNPIGPANLDGKAGTLLTQGDTIKVTFPSGGVVFARHPPVVSFSKPSNTGLNAPKYVADPNAAVEENKAKPNSGDIVYEFNIGEQDAYIMPSKAGSVTVVEFTVQGFDVLSDVTWTGKMAKIQTFRGTAVVAEGEMSLPKTGSGVVWQYGRADELGVGKAVSRMNIGFTTRSALKAGDYITIEACRTASNVDVCSYATSSPVFNGGAQLNDLTSLISHTSPTTRRTDMFALEYVSKTQMKLKVQGDVPADQYEVQILSLAANSPSNAAAGFLSSNGQGGSETVTFKVVTTNDSFAANNNNLGFTTGNALALTFLKAESAKVGTPPGFVGLGFTPKTWSSEGWIEVTSNFAFFGKNLSPSLGGSGSDAKLGNEATCKGFGVVSNLGKTIRYTYSGCPLGAGKDTALVLSQLNSYPLAKGFFAFDVRTSSDKASTYFNINGKDLAPVDAGNLGDNRWGILTGETGTVNTKQVNCDSVAPGATGATCAFAFSPPVADTTTKIGQFDVTVTNGFNTAARRRLLATAATVGGVTCTADYSATVMDASTLSLDLSSCTMQEGADLTVTVTDMAALPPADTTVIVSATTASSGTTSTKPAETPPAVASTFAVIVEEAEKSNTPLSQEASSALVIDTSSSFTTGTTCVTGQITTATKVANQDPQFLTVRFTNDQPLKAGDFVYITSSQPIFGLNQKVSVKLDSGRFVGCTGSASTTSYNRVAIQLQEPITGGCSLSAKAETGVTITDWGTLTTGLNKNPDAGVDVDFYVTTTKDTGTPKYGPGYRTYGFVAGSFKTTNQRDDRVTLEYRIRTQIAGGQDRVRCVALNQGAGVPSLESVMGGNQAFGMQPAQPAELVFDTAPGANPATVQLLNLVNARSYDVYCAMEAGKVVSNKIPVSTVGFAGPLKLADSNTYRIDAVDVAAVVVGSPTDQDSVNCVAVNAALSAPSALAVFENQNTAGTTVAVVGGKRIVNANEVEVFKFVGLKEASSYDIYCAGQKGDTTPYRSTALRVTTGGYEQHVVLKGSTTATTAVVEATLSADSDLSCIAVAGETKPATPTAASIRAGKDASGTNAASAPPAVKAFRSVRATIVFEKLTPMRQYHVFCSSSTSFITPPADRSLSFTTKGASGIAGDPHVQGSDGKFADFFGESGVYNVYSTETMQVNARLGLAVRESSRMLWHPTVMKAGTLVQEAGVAIGETRLRLALHAGGLVSVSDPSVATTFLTSAADQELSIGGVKVQWTKVSETKAFPWGVHAYTQRLELSTADDTVVLQVVESQGYRFIDINVEGEPSAATGLLNVAMSAPVELRRQLARQREVDFLVGAASGDLFAAQQVDGNVPMLA